MQIDNFVKDEVVAEVTKDTMYVDVDDEITAIIEKVRESRHKIIALVLPKRAAALQSIVNMKLLKRTAHAERKQLVLITSEASILPLAGAVGLHVAKSLQSKPAIPPPPEVPKQPETVVDDEGGEAEEVDKTKTVGELAGLSGSTAGAKASAPEDTIDIDNAENVSDKAKSKKVKGKSRLKVPNFDKFRTRLFLAFGGLILFIIFLIFATKVWPKATITIKTNAVDVTTTFSFTADTAAKSLDESQSIVPASVKNETVTNSQKVSATGQKNVGDPATGTMTITNCADSNAITIPSGTTFTANNLTFLSTQDVSVPGSSFSIHNGQISCNADGHASVTVQANTGGADHNIGPTTYTVGKGGDFRASGSQMSGGTDKTVTIVQQSDIDGAVEKLTQNTDKAKADLSKQFDDEHLFPLTATIVGGKPTITTDNKVGDQASDVTVTTVINFTMLGVHRDDLKKLVTNAAKGQIDLTKQAISDDGLDKAIFGVTTHDNANKQTLSVQTTATAGAQIDQEALKKQIVGKKSGDVQTIVQDLPSVQNVNVKFSPFWVNKVPSNTKKINIIVQKDQATANGGTSQ